MLTAWRKSMPWAAKPSSTGVRTEARGRTVDEWKLKASAVDNHWLDCLVGCAAAASMLGVSLFRGAMPKKVKRNRKHVAYL
ncbi:MAG: hypothetical protein IMZ69_00835 [Spirochaetes bacterium]|nr:hypothetical protein [Spirochaetota bacterium]